MDLTAGWAVPEDSTEWPLVLGLRLRLTTLPQRVPAGAGRFLDLLGRDWEEAVGSRPAPPERDVSGAEPFASVRVELAEARATFPRLGLEPVGAALRFRQAGPPGAAGRVEKAAGAAGLRAAGDPGWVVLGDPAGNLKPTRVTRYEVARVSLAQDARGYAIPQVDRFVLSPVCPCGRADCPDRR